MLKKQIFLTTWKIQQVCLVWQLCESLYWSMGIHVKNCGNFQNYSFNAGIIQYWPRVTHRRKSMIRSSVFYVQLSILSLSPQTCQDILCLQISTEAWKKTAVKSMELYVPADCRILFNCIKKHKENKSLLVGCSQTSKLAMPFTLFPCK